MTGKELNRVFVSALFVVPTGSLSGWKELGYNKIPQNKVSIVEEKSIKIEVNHSASPLIFKLPEIKTVSKISAQFRFAGEHEKLKSKTFPEDFLLRIGLVAQGDKSLSWLQKKLAANWVLELFSLAPKGVGLDKIYFFNIATAKELVGQSRPHPKSELMLEEIIGHFPDASATEHKLKKPLNVVALWISVDGDDTKSVFTTTIDKLSLDVSD